MPGIFSMSLDEIAGRVDANIAAGHFEEFPRRAGCDDAIGFVGQRTYAVTFR
jgi:hypothetical protein